MVPKPNLTPILIKRSIREIPVTISAFSMGMLVIPIIMARFLFFMPLMAMQATVPIQVEMAAERKAISSVLYSASNIMLFWNSS